MVSAFGQIPVTYAIAAFAGMLAFPLAIPSRDVEPGSNVESRLSATSATAGPSVSCMASTICEVKERVRWRTPAWKPAFCEEIARAVLESSKRYAIPPPLILAVMINESDMNEKAFRTTMKSGSLYAKDGGLMGIRCIVDEQGRCTNGFVRGLTWKEVMDPVTNIDLAARELARWRDGGGVTSVTVRTRDGNGELRAKQRNVPCTHKTHAYWAHYNHGPRYIDRGRARHYPHRIAVLYFALARAMHMDTTALMSMKLTVTDPGRRPRTADKPVEARYRKLCQSIRDVVPVCGDQSTAQLQAARSE